MPFPVSQVPVSSARPPAKRRVWRWVGVTLGALTGLGVGAWLHQRGFAALLGALAGSMKPLPPLTENASSEALRRAQRGEVEQSWNHTRVFTRVAVPPPVDSVDADDVQLRASLSQKDALKLNTAVEQATAHVHGLFQQLGMESLPRFVVRLDRRMPEVGENQSTTVGWIEQSDTMEEHWCHLPVSVVQKWSKKRLAHLLTHEFLHLATERRLTRIAKRHGVVHMQQRSGYWVTRIRADDESFVSEGEDLNEAVNEFLTSLAAGKRDPMIVYSGNANRIEQLYRRLTPENALRWVQALTEGKLRGSLQPVFAFLAERPGKPPLSKEQKREVFERMKRLDFVGASRV